MRSVLKMARTAVAGGIGLGLWGVAGVFILVALYFSAAKPA